MKHHSLKWLALLLLALAPMSRAAEPSTQPPTSPATTQAAFVPGPTEFTIHPARADEASYKLRLLPPVVEQTVGDAAPLYLIAASTPPEPVPPYPGYDAAKRKKLWDQVNEMEGAGEKEFSSAEGRKLLGEFKSRLAETEVAAHRTQAHWEPSLRTKGMATRLPYMDNVRQLALLLALKNRVEIADGHWDDALRSMQDSMAMAQHLNADPCMIQALIAHGLVDLALQHGAREWIAHPGSANLYWALTAIPSPTSSLRQIAQWEQIELIAFDPKFKQALNDDLPSDDWPAVVKEIAGFQKVFDGSDGVDADKLVQTSLPRAREFLIAHGTPKAQAEAMPAEQAVGRYLFAEYQYVWLEMWKGWELSTPQALAQIERSWREMNQQFPAMMENPLISAFFRGHSKERSRLENERRMLGNIDETLAALRTIEAIRDYAARHDGNPPARLDLITDVPVPVDPMTLKPMSYELKGRTFTLRAAAPYEKICWYQVTVAEK